MGGSGEFAGRTGTWFEASVRTPGFPELGNFIDEVQIIWDQRPHKPRK